jgi:hypothetical protein
VSSGFAAIRWARSAPVVRRTDDRPDATAHHVLLLLATFADSDGRARPSVDTLAEASTLTVDTVVTVLRKLASARLITSEGGWGKTGATVWRLNLTATRDEASTLSDRQEQARAKAAGRSRRYRQRRNVVTVSDTVTHEDSDGAGHRDVTPSDTVTNGSVTVSHTVRHGVPHRHVTVSDTVRHGPTTVITADDKPRSPIELHIELPLNSTPAAAPPSERNGYTPAFEAFWSAYGRKGAKRTAATEWAKAVKRADPTVIMTKVGPYVASTPDPKYRKDAERWLKGDCWESAIVAATRATNGHVPYQNPADQSAYDAPI